MSYMKIELPNFCDGCVAGEFIRAEYQDLQTSPVHEGLRHSRRFAEALELRKRGISEIGEIAVAIGCQEVESTPVEIPEDPVDNSRAIELMKNCPAYLEYYQRHNGA